MPHIAADERATTAGYGLGNRGHICEDLKIPGACVRKDSIPFYMCRLKLVKSV
jgi:hypothetical protein